MAVRLGACAAARSAVRFITCPIAVSLPQFSTLRTSGSSAVIPMAQTTGRFLSTVKFMDEKRSGEETVYFKKEDDILLQNLLANHPEYDPKYSWNQSELGALAKDVTLACQKHGMKDPSAAFMKDLISIFASHGYKKEGSAK